MWKCNPIRCYFCSLKYRGKMLWKFPPFETDTWSIFAPFSGLNEASTINYWSTISYTANVTTSYAKFCFQIHCAAFQELVKLIWNSTQIMHFARHSPGRGYFKSTFRLRENLAQQSRTMGFHLLIKLWATEACFGIKPLKNLWKPHILFSIRIHVLINAAW